MTSTITKNTSEINKLPAGGTNPNQFDVLEAWYPIHYIDDLDKSKLTRFTILNKDVVIWWDKQTSAFKVFEDKCPHRLVPLSEGRVAEDGLLECPYHGWAFSGNGECERIPQQPEGKRAETSQRACVKSFPTSVKQGLLFIFPGKPENAEKIEVPIIEAIEETPDEWVVLNTFRDLPYDALTLLENVIDSSHIPFTHHATVGNRDSVSPVELELVESGKNGFTGIWQDGPRKGTLGKQDTSFIAPGVVCHDLTAKQLGRTLTVVYATPIRKGECRLFARFPFKFASKLPAFFIKLTPRWYSHISNNRILEDDQIFLHYQERFLEESGGSPNFNKAFYLPTKADTYVSELRKWVNQYNANPFPGETLPPRLSTEKLLDRYNSHTKHCASCRKALARIKQLRILIMILAAVTWAMIPLTYFLQNQSVVLPLSFSGIFLLSLAGWFALGRLEQRMTRGEEIPPRNLP